jgi:DNA repair exonuclease SbcCD nuclease subunit
MRFLHTADWQIGKVFKQFGPKEEALRQARLTAIERLGQLARQNRAEHVFVAGDIYDNEVPTPINLRAPIERIKPFSDIHWHLLPGNHDPARSEGIWDRVAELGLPPHIHIHRNPAAVPLSHSAFLLPAPLQRKSEYGDLTEWMDGAVTPPGALRVGLAHGAVTSFTSEGEAANPIDPTRPEKAGLNYLALGDWHRTCQIGPSVWYAGTPEPDRAGGQERGTALLVEIQGSGAPAVVTPLSVGTYRWLTRSERLSDSSEFSDLDQRLRAEGDLSHVILRLRLEGTLPLAAHVELQRRLFDLEAAVFHLDVEQTGLVARPTQADLEAIDFDGVLRRSADHLKAMADDPAQPVDVRRRADAALIELYVRAADRSARGTI